jgi:hypothetical protein
MSHDVLYPVQAPGQPVARSDARRRSASADRLPDRRDRTTTCTVTRPGAARWPAHFTGDSRTQRGYRPGSIRNAGASGFRRSFATKLPNASNESGRSRYDRLPPRPRRQDSDRCASSATSAWGSWGSDARTNQNDVLNTVCRWRGQEGSSLARSTAANTQRHAAGRTEASIVRVGGRFTRHGG